MVCTNTSIQPLTLLGSREPLGLLAQSLLRRKRSRSFAAVRHTPFPSTMLRFLENSLPTWLRAPRETATAAVLVLKDPRWKHEAHWVFPESPREQ